MKFLDTLKNSLVDEWKQAYKWFSTYSYIAIGALVTFAVTERETFDMIVSYLPSEVKPFVGILLTVSLLYLRLKKQGSAT